MGIFDWLFGRTPREKYRGKPLIRRRGRIYWKGTPIDDDLFSEHREYNAYLRKHYIRKGKRYFRRHFRRFRHNKI